MSLQKKINKLQRDPKLFFKDMFLKKYIPIKNKAKAITPKKKNGYSKYVIVSAVYNVEKYLNDYFNSIINQRLDFKNNIHIICVDDGSSDNSAKIIKHYQKKYPKNITYIYKENGGQASARNLGLKLLQEDPNLKDKFTWVTFTDPDDFVDRDYFYEVDEFLQKNEKYNIACVVCAINTFNTIGVYRKHPANFFTKSHIPVSLNDSTLDIITTSTRSFFLINDIKNMQLNFDTNIKTFEDCKFYLSYIQNNRNNNKYITYLSSAIYYARKRPDSTMKNIDLENYIKSLYTIQDIFQNNIQSHNKVLSVSQNVSLFHLFYLTKDIVDNNLKNINLELGKNLLYVLDNIFSKISVDTILDSTINKFSFHYKIGML
ncbi:MAG: glycosyltransferase family 2 protein, partial [Campylobacter sp.]|nr:glycosyltransferase family 2 protein [Campylobacter sp.]